MNKNRFILSQKAMLIICALYIVLSFIFNEYIKIFSYTLLILNGFIMCLSLLCMIHNKNMVLIYTIPVFILTLGVYSGMTAYFDNKNIENTKAAATENIVAADDENTEYVFITKSGGKYHKENCRYISNKETIKISISEAIQDDITPCDRCFN